MRSVVLISIALFSGSAVGGCGQPTVADIEISAEQVEQLSDRRIVTEIAPLSRHELLVGTSGGLVKLDLSSSAQTVYRWKEGLPSSRITALSTVDDGRAVVGTANGLALWSEKAIEVAPFDREAPPSRSVTALAHDSQGGIYVGTQRGAGYLKDGKWSFVHDGHWPALRPVTDIEVAGDGTVWFGKIPVLTRLLSDGSWELHEFWPHRTAPRVASGLILSLGARLGGALMVGTGYGLSEQDGQGWRSELYMERMSSPGKLQDPWIEDVASEPLGRSWVAHGDAKAEEGGLGAAYREGDGKWRYLTEKDGLSSNFVYGIRQGLDGSIYFATSRGISRLNDGEIFSYPLTGELPDNNIRAVRSARQGGVAVLTATALVLFAESAGRAAVIPLPDEVDEAADILFFDGNRTVLGAPRGGLWELNGSKFEKLPACSTSEPILGFTFSPHAVPFCLTPSKLRKLKGAQWSDEPLDLGLEVMRAESAQLVISKTNERWYLLADRDGRVVSAISQATPSGQLRTVPLPQPVLDGARWELGLSPSGAVTLAGARGFFVLGENGASWQRLGEALPRGALVSSAWLNGDTVLFGTAGRGLFMESKGVLRRVTLEGRELPGVISALTVDSSGRVVVGTSDQGLLTISGL